MFNNSERTDGSRIAFSRNFCVAYINTVQRLSVKMSNVFDAVDIRRSARTESIFSTFPKNRAVFDIVNNAPPAVVVNVKPPVHASTTEKSASTTRPLHTVHVLWVLCVCCLVTPFIAGIFNDKEGDLATFPYKCNLFFLSLVVGLPGASVHLFCCSLCLFSRNKFALVFSVVSIFLHILTVEVACGMKGANHFSFYLLIASIFTGVASQISIIECISDTKFRQKNSLAVMYFSLLLVCATLCFLTTLCIDIFKIKLKQEKRLYLQSLPMVFALLAHLLSTYSTLRPIFLVIETLSTTSL